MSFLRFELVTITATAVVLLLLIACMPEGRAPTAEAEPDWNCHVKCWDGRRDHAVVDFKVTVENNADCSCSRGTCYVGRYRFNGGLCRLENRVK